MAFRLTHFSQSRKELFSGCEDFVTLPAVSLCGSLGTLELLQQLNNPFKADVTQEPEPESNRN
jgi:hypothetical protein